MSILSIYQSLFILLISFLPLTLVGQNNSTWAEKLGYPSGKKIIILHADDIGMCDEANISAVDYLLKQEIQSAAIMMPCPTAEAFTSWAVQNPSLDIGLHLTLTSEWKTYRWGSVADATEVPSLLDEDGMLWHEVIDVVMHASAGEIEKEIRAQLEKAIALGLTPSHMDTHMGTLFGNHKYTAAYTKVAEEYGIPAMIIDFSNKEVVEGFRKAGYPITPEMISIINNYKLPKLDYFSSVPKGKTYKEMRDNFYNLIHSLNPGLTEIIFHPSVYSEDLKLITNSWQQRVWESQMFSDPEVLQFFEDNELVFTNWKEIMERFKKIK